jgi:cytochrome c biogenesis protein CcmG/thiol:disulfide interchange protein DsbE
LAAGLLVLVAAGLAMWGPGGGAAAQPSGRLLPGQPAPEFALNLLDGSTLTFSELRGRVAVVNFWATWCPPCEDELPDLEAVWAEYQAQGVVFVGVAFQEEGTEVRDMASRFGLTYPLGLDEGERISTAFGITGVPETFVVDAQGQVAYVHIGPVTAGELRGQLDSLLGQ